MIVKKTPKDWGQKWVWQLCPYASMQNDNPNLKDLVYQDHAEGDQKLGQTIFIGTSMSTPTAYVEGRAMTLSCCDSFIITHNNFRRMNINTCVPELEGPYLPATRRSSSRRMLRDCRVFRAVWTFASEYNRINDYSWCDARLSAVNVD